MKSGDLFVLRFYDYYGCYDNGEQTYLNRCMGGLSKGDVIMFLGETSINQAGTRTSKVLTRLGVGWLVLLTVDEKNTQPSQAETRIPR